MKKLFIVGVFTLATASFVLADDATKQPAKADETKSTVVDSKASEAKPADVEPKDASKAPASEGYFASISNTVSEQLKNVETTISNNPKAAMAIVALATGIATAIIVAKSKAVQSFLGFEVEEDEELFA